MRCRACEYPLWNLTARQCPECGAPFAPSEYEFKVGYVQYKCPHCGQSYYGTDEKGHLEPREFDCVSCGRHLAMDEMVLLPSEGVEDEHTRLRDPVPWLARAKVGFLRGWFKTVFSGMGTPAKLARALPRESPAGQAWWFAVLTLLVCTLGAVAPFMAMFIFAGGMSTGRLASGFGMAVLIVAAVQLAWLVVWGLTVHAALRMLGVSHARLGRTYEFLCYTCGPCLIVAIPCLGIYLCWISNIWWAIAGAAMISVGYGVKGWKAGLAAFVLPVLALSTGALFIAVAFLGAFQASATSRPPAPGAASWPMASPGAEQIAYVLRDYGFGERGGRPTHAAQFVAIQELGVSELIAPDSASTGSSVRIGDMSFNEFSALSGDDRDRVAAAVESSLPARVAAHRIGDVVFTYHGMDSLPSPDPGLWVFIIWLDPEANDADSATFTVGTADGSTRSYPSSALSLQLQAQNSLRGVVGLTPLPHPSTVTHGAPATSESTPGGSTDGGGS